MIGLDQVFINIVSTH